MGWLRGRIKWLWDNLQTIVMVAGWAMSFVLPAWAVIAAGLFVAYSPFSWVAAGFLGMLIAAASVYLFSLARSRFVRAGYDARMLAKGGLIDPMGKTFERKRIYLNEFALPSHPMIEGKTFIDCEIIGPANVLLEYGNHVDDPKAPVCDAVILAGGRQFYNGYTFRNCTFRGCSLQRVTLFIAEAALSQFVHLNWLNWITYAPPDPPVQGLDLFNLPAVASAPPSPPDTEPGTPQ